MRIGALDIPRGPAAPLPIGDQYVVSRRVSREEARRQGAAAITGASAGPAFDAVPPPELFYVPLYRVEVAVEGLDIGLGGLHYVNGRIVPSPAIASGRREHVHLTLARRFFPQRLITFSSLAVHRSNLEPRGEAELKGTVLDPDVTRREAEEAAMQAVLARVENPSMLSLYSKREPRTLSVYCLYPVYVFRYVVDDLEYHLTLCGHTGAVVSQHAPSRALLQKGPIVYFNPESGSSEEGPGPASKDPRATGPVGANAHAIRTRISAEDARERSRKAIVSSVLRPSDIEKSRILEPKLFHVPYWRVDVSVDSFHVRLSSTSHDPTIYPGGGSRGQAVIELARRTPAEQTRALDRDLADAAVAVAQVRTLAIDPRTIEPRDVVSLPGEVIEADVSQDQAVQEAVARIVRQVHRPNTLFSRIEPRVHGAVLCHVPLWVTRYEYSGEIVLSETRFYVVVSGVTGAVVHAHHPSAPRALAAKLRKLLSFDRR